MTRALTVVLAAIGAWLWLSSQTTSVLAQQPNEGKIKRPTDKQLAQWYLNHPWIDKNEDGKVSPEEYDQFMQFESVLARKAYELYKPRGSYKAMPYRVMEPYNYDPEKSYPLILSLHGAGGRGDDNSMQIRAWNRWILKEDWREKYPCFVIAPQSTSSWSITGDAPFERPRPTGNRADAPSARGRERGQQEMERTEGSLSLAFEIMDKFIEEHNVDKNRIYVIGHSMGGMGTLRAIWERPDFFAGAAFCAGRLRQSHGREKIADVPIWGFVGTRDTMFHRGMEELFSELKKLDGNMKLTVCKDVSHDVVYIYSDYNGDNEAKDWITSYATDRCDREPNVWKWLFKQRLSDRK